LPTAWRLATSFRRGRQDGDGHAGDDPLRFADSLGKETIMANITRFSPARALERFSPFEEFERMLENMRMRPMAGAAGSFGGDFRLDVFEDDNAYVVKAEMPGVAKDDIRISVDGNQVSIAAEVKQEQKDEGRNMLCAERFHGQLYRSFTLENPVDEEKADARYESGVLELTLPKKAGGRTHQLRVH
jgi:HSP20 family protein